MQVSFEDFYALSPQFRTCWRAPFWKSVWNINSLECYKQLCNREKSIVWAEKFASNDKLIVIIAAIEEVHLMASNKMVDKERHHFWDAYTFWKMSVVHTVYMQVSFEDFNAPSFQFHFVEGPLFGKSIWNAKSLECYKQCNGDGPKHK